MNNHSPSRFPFPEDGATNRARHRTVDRMSAILENVARSATPLTLSDIAHAISAPVSSCQSLVNGLVAAGFLEEDNRTYQLGMAPYLLSTMAGRRPVETVTHEMLEDIVAETGYIAVLAVLIGSNVYYLDYAASDPSFEYLAQNRLKRSPLETSAGWILLSGMDDAVLWGFLAGLDADQEHVNSFHRHFPEVRQSGECVAPGVALNGADGVAVAVRDRSDKVVAAVSVIASEEQIAADAEHVIEVLRRHRVRLGG